MNMKKVLLTILLAAAYAVTLHAQQVGEEFDIAGCKYQITSINPNEVKLLKATSAHSDIFDDVNYNNQTYTITSVGYEAFNGVNKNRVVFYFLESIDAHAFNGVVSREIDLSGCPLTEIAKDAFKMAGVQSVLIPSSVTIIGEKAFRGDSEMSKLVGGTIINIEASAFYGCGALASIDLSHVESIGEDAFLECTSLSNISLPQGLTSVGKYAFYYCRLKTLTMYNTTSTFGGQNNMMASNGVVTMHIVDWDNKNVLANQTYVPMAINYVYNDAPVTGNYTVPSTITVLGEGALYHAAGLTGITLPASLTSIGQHAFGKCTNLTSITSNATTAPAVANANAFSGVTRSIPVTIPDNAATYYSYRHTTGWKDFTNYQVSLQTIKDEAIMELNDAANNRSEQSIQDMLSDYIAQVNTANSKAEVETILTAAIKAIPLAISKIDCIAAVNAAAVGVVSDNLQALIDGYVTRINAATTISQAESIRDEAIAAFKLMKDKQPMIDVLESKKVGVQSEAILNRIQGYIDYISKPSTTLAQATTKYNEAITILEYILEGYNEGYTAPTYPGMRLKVTKKDGKVYEFQVTEMESTEYYRATE